ncbi:MAG: LptF/LptG family permease [Bacteroidales bacterium]|nr:LptF/LptG family permease [Bacteroidales bacterium]
MKKLDWLLVKSFLGPLLLTFSISEFVLLLQWLFKVLERIVGKGIDTIVILQLFWYLLITIIPMALPLAVLLASIITMGNFGEKYELVAIKAAGIPLFRVFRPLMIVVSFLSIFAFFCANNFVPMALKKQRTIMYEISSKKPSINIRPNEYYSDIDNYVIRIGDKHKDGKNLSDIIIYDHSKDLGNISVTKAKTGQMYSKGNYLYFRLQDGFTYDETTDNSTLYTNPLLRINFKEQTLRFDISDFAYKESEDENRYANHYKMMSIERLIKNIDDLKKENDAYNRTIIKGIQNKMELDKYFDKQKEERNNNSAVFHPQILDEKAKNSENNIKKKFQKENSANSVSNKKEDIIAKEDIPIKDTIKDNYSFYEDYALLDKSQRKRVNDFALQDMAIIRSDVKMLSNKKDSDNQYVRLNKNEFHRKFTLSVACIILFFIGAPLGAIVRKGGLGMPVVLSAISFILYYVFGMIGEKAASEGALSCWLGMWSATIIFFIIGLFLTLKATSDAAFLSLDTWQKAYDKILLKIKKCKK